MDSNQESKEGSRDREVVGGDEIVVEDGFVQFGVQILIEDM